MSSGIVFNVSIAAFSDVHDVRKEAIIVIASLIAKSNDLEEMLLNYELESILL